VSDKLSLCGIRNRGRLLLCGARNRGRISVSITRASACGLSAAGARMVERQALSQPRLAAMRASLMMSKMFVMRSDWANRCTAASTEPVHGVAARHYRFAV
jgi:hypothetical protein